MKNYKPKRKADDYEVINDPAIWDNEEWFRHMYEEKKLGKRTIARIINRSKIIVMRRLHRYGIETRHEKHTSDHPCCSRDWLLKHYCNRFDYLEWCEENNEKPKDGYGMGMGISSCAKAADVNEYTIYNWLAKFGIYIREPLESHTTQGCYQYHEKNIMEETEIRDKKGA